MYVIWFVDLILIACLHIRVSNSMQQQLCDCGACWTWQGCCYMQGIEAIPLQKG